MHSPTAIQAGDKVLSERVYSPEPLLQHPWRMLAAIAADVWAGRELAWRLFMRDLKAQYRQTVLGYVWAFLPPLVASLTFIFLQSQGITRIEGTGIAYPAFAMMGTLLWQIFADSMQSPLNSFGAAKAMLVKINFPREAVLLGGLYMVVFNFFIRLLLVIAVMIWWSVPVNETVLFFPVAVGGLMAAGLAIGLLLLPVSSLYGDVGRVIPIVSGFWMLLTPVVYPPRTEGLAGWLATWNPVSPLIVTARECLTAQPFSMLGPFFIVLACSLLAIFLGLVGFRMAMPHLIARMGG
ncbi:MAG: ABC transporter permease [Chthoniobacterales bacterium]|nr:ABC transporter permease [Chthoniobacterales bacterium]